MQISAINNNNKQSFGHSFRVSISLKDASGNIKFVNPYENNKLYKQLNSKIVNRLNEDYYTNLRNLYGIARKTQKAEPETQKYKELSAKLRQIDDDYSRFNVVRSVYRRNKLGYIATGTDVPMIENIKGAKQIGIAKADVFHSQGSTHSDYVKALCKAVKGNILDYVEHDNILLRSPNNKEIMLKATFKPTKTTKGKENYELDNFEFHENTSLRTLKPVNPNFLRFKHSNSMLYEIQQTIQNHLNKILGKRVHFSDFDKVLNPKIKTEVKQTPKDTPKQASKPAAEKQIKQEQVKQKAPKQTPQNEKRKGPVQLEIDYGE